MIAILIALLSFSAAEPPAPMPGPGLTQEQTEKQNYELLALLMENARVSLSGKKFCDSFVKSKHETVGKFMAWSLSFYSKDQANSVQSSCEKINGAEFCTIEFDANSKGESPWSCGLRFQMRPKRKGLQVKTIECIGTC